MTTDPAEPIATAIVTINQTALWLENLALFLDKAGLLQESLVVTFGAGAIISNTTTLRRCAQALDQSGGMQ